MSSLPSILVISRMRKVTLFYRILRSLGVAGQQTILEKLAEKSKKLNIYMNLVPYSVIYCEISFS